MSGQPFTTRPGDRLPHGATATRDGVNFSIFSRQATRMWLSLYDAPDASEPVQVIALDPGVNRTFFFWHVFVEGARPAMYYTWRAAGPGDTQATGCRFDARRELLDPWARSVSAALWDRARAVEAPGSSGAIRAMVVDDDGYDWEGDQRIDHSFEESVIYELHVGGFTRHPTSGVRNPGTFRALAEKVPYLESLGVTDVELLPVMAFDTQDVPASTAALGLTNFWGYTPYGFFAPHGGYAMEADARREFRDMVKAFHRAGIGVILDVVFNHTAEGSAEGPTIHFKGLANETFYHLDPEDRSRYRDYTGCGNTVNCNHPVVADYLIRCLEYWVREMHVDGFRFDLASVMARGEDGRPMYHAPVLWAIEFSPVLAHTKIIAEAWDAGGLYQVGDFPGFRWMEWNGRYRDVVRRVVRGDPGLMHELATRISGSSDLHEGKGKLPVNSVNYVTCHDGFTLWDLVSYNSKHNEANGEENRDGTNDNNSWNCGHEGPTDDPEINVLRRRLARNHLALLLLSHGIPMLSAGDEVLRSQQGNNNVYCQDNELGWFDWSLPEKNADMLRFTRELIAIRKRHPSLRRNRFLTGIRGSARDGLPDVTWYGPNLGNPRWDNADSRMLAFMLAGLEPSEEDLYVMLNMSAEPSAMALPPVTGRAWFRALDTSLEPPDDIAPSEAQEPVEGRVYRVHPRTVVVLESR